MAAPPQQAQIGCLGQLPGGLDGVCELLHRLVRGILVLRLLACSLGLLQGLGPVGSLVELTGEGSHVAGQLRALSVQLLKHLRHQRVVRGALALQEGGIDGFTRQGMSERKRIVRHLIYELSVDQGLEVLRCEMNRNVPILRAVAPARP